MQMIETEVQRRNTPYALSTSNAFGNISECFQINLVPSYGLQSIFKECGNVKL